MWPKKEAPFIRSLLEFSNNVAAGGGSNYHDVVTDSESCFTSGWENIRPRAIYRSNRCNGRRKLRTVAITASSPVTRKCQHNSSRSPNNTYVMRGTLDDNWNYHYPTAASNKTSGARDTTLQEITEDVVKETNCENNQCGEQIHVQKLREAIAALVKKDHQSVERRHGREQADMLTQSSDTTAYRWAVQKPKTSALTPQGGAQLMTQGKDRGVHKVTSIPHHMHQLTFDCEESSQLLNVRQLPVATGRTNQTVNRHKVLDPTIRYELSQLVQSQLYNRLLLEQQSVNDQLLKVSSAHILPSSSSSAQHSELYGSRSYPNISTNNNKSGSFHNTTALNRFPLPRKSKF